MISTTRETLLKIPESTLFNLFNGRWKDQLQRDKNGNTFFDFNSILFRHLLDQFTCPRDVFLDTKTDSLIVCDGGNRRVMRWPRQNGTRGEILISYINCNGLTMDTNGYLYVSDLKKHEVRRWKIGEQEGSIVASGNGEGDQLNQLNMPFYLFVADWINNRVMKWVKDAKEGIIVAGGHGQGKSLMQLHGPSRAIVDHLENVYVSDAMNNRIMVWPKGSKEGRILICENGRGNKSDQLDYPIGLSFDRQGNIYVADYKNKPLINSYLQ